MVKAISFFKRKSGMSVEGFQEYWRTAHADLVVKMPGIRRYVQSHTRLSGYRKAEPIYDGIAEVWFDDTQAMRAMAGTPEYAAVQADELRFIDRASLGLIITEDHVIKDGPAPPNGVKNIEFITHKPGMTIEAFQKYWREAHGPLAALILVVRRYVQSHTRRAIYESGRTPPYDGVALTWFDDTEAMRRSAATPEYARVRADEANFITPGSPFIIAREHIIFPG
ncbi:MAG: EthD domain-containing protein [Candidatus Rokubacteria bacterium]|nr:EthD domain-containing protein [Candidatus Rokubacteria bacterium]